MSKYCAVQKNSVPAAADPLATSHRFSAQQSIYQTDFTFYGGNFPARGDFHGLMEFHQARRHFWHFQQQRIERAASSQTLLLRRH